MKVLPLGKDKQWYIVYWGIKFTGNVYIKRYMWNAHSSTIPDIQIQKQQLFLSTVEQINCSIYIQCNVTQQQEWTNYCYKQQLDETNTNIKWKKSDHRNTYTQWLETQNWGKWLGRHVGWGGYFWVAGSVLFLDLGIIGYTDVFTLWKVIRLCTPMIGALVYFH